MLRAIDSSRRNFIVNCSRGSRRLKQMITPLVASAMALIALPGYSTVTVTLSSPTESPTKVEASTSSGERQEFQSVDTSPFDHTARSAHLKLEITPEQIQSSLDATASATTGVGTRDTASADYGAHFSLDIVSDTPTAFFFEAITYQEPDYDYSRITYRFYTPGSEALDVVFGSDEGIAEVGSIEGFLVPHVTYRLDFLNRGLAVATPGINTAFAQAIAASALLFTVPEPTSIKGSYDGLVKNAADPSPDTSGRIRLHLTTSRRFTGKLTGGAKTYPLSGVFASDGTARPIILAKHSRAGVVTLSLRLEQVGETSRVVGSLTRGATSSAAVTAAHIKYDAETNPAPPALLGSYTALLRRPTWRTSAELADGGFATVQIDRSGTLRMVGRLGDGARISIGSMITSTNTVPVFATPEEGGVLIGTIGVGHRSGVSDFSGIVDRIKPPTTGPLNPIPLKTKLHLIGSRYQYQSGVPLVDVADVSPNLDFLVLGFASGIGFFQESITLTAMNGFTVPAGSKLQDLTIDTRTGLLSGNFVQEGVTRRLMGVIFQEQNMGAGSVFGESDSAPFEFRPLP